MSRRIAIVKLGSSSVTRDEGPDPVLFAQTMQSVSRVQAAGWSVVLVSSGAAALGSVLLAASHHHDPDRVASRPLRSAVGQPELMSVYRFLGDVCGLEVCQILLSANDLQDPSRMERVAALVHEATAAGRLPILNGNDSTDATVYDNDSLAASIAIACRAEHLVLLSDVDGVLAADGTTVVRRIDPTDVAGVSSLGRSSSGTGGIRAKVRSAQLAALNGVRCTIARASEPGIIERVLADDEVGTELPAVEHRPPSGRSAWISGIASPSGQITVNREAEESIRQGASLFGSGVKKVTGDFGPGSIVEIVTPRKRLIGRGAVRVSSGLLDLARAMQPGETASLYMWLLAQVSDDPFHDVHETPRSARAIASARANHSDEAVADMGREVLTMFPSLFAARALEPTSEGLREPLVALTQRFSLIDNRRLVTFPSAAGATED
jgi:glutamate 5-kinase